MYYIVEIPHLRPVSAWKAEPSEVIAQANRMTQRSGESFYEQTTPRQLLAQFGYQSIEEARAEEDAGVADTVQTLAGRFGMDTAIYKGFGEAEDWQTKPVDELTCALNYIGHDLSSLHVFQIAEDALRAITEEPEFNCHQGARAEQALRDLIQPDLEAEHVVRALKDGSVEPDADYTADAGQDYGYVAAWKFGEKYAIQYGNNGQTDYDWADDADDLACWLESPDLDGQNTLIQTANVRGADAVTEASEDDEGPFLILVSHDYYGPYTTHDLVRDYDTRLQDIMEFATYAEAEEWIETEEDGIYVTDHNEIGRPSYKIVTA